MAANNMTPEDFADIWHMVGLMCVAAGFEDVEEEKNFKRKQFSTEVARRLAARQPMPPPLPPPPPPQP